MPFASERTGPTYPVIMAGLVLFYFSSRKAAKFYYLTIFMAELNLTCCSLNTFLLKFLFMLFLNCDLFTSKLVLRLSPARRSCWDVGLIYSGGFRKLRILILWKFNPCMAIWSIIIDTVLNYPLFHLSPFITYVNLLIYSFMWWAQCIFLIYQTIHTFA